MALGISAALYATSATTAYCGGATEENTAVIPGKSDSVPVFAGVLNESNHTLFALARVGADGKLQHNGWHALGGAVDGFTLIDYDAKGEILFLKDSTNSIIQLRLTEGRVKAANLPPFSREQAKGFLNDIIARKAQEASELPAHVTLNFNVDEDATSKEKTLFAQARAEGDKKGQIVVFARAADGLHTVFTAPMPRKFLPPYVAPNLTEEDWEAFQVSLAVTTFQVQMDRHASGFDRKVAPGEQRAPQNKK